MPKKLRGPVIYDDDDDEKYHLTHGRIIMTSIVRFKVVTVPEAKEPITSIFVGGANIMFPVVLDIVSSTGSQMPVLTIFLVSLNC